MARYIWPGIKTDARRWDRSCLRCQWVEVHRHTSTPLGTFATPDAKLGHVHVDSVGPLIVFYISLHVWIDSLGGLKLFPSRIALLRRLLKHSSKRGCLGSVHLLQWLPTGVVNSNRIYGKHSPAPSCLPITPVPMAWWSVYIRQLKASLKASPYLERCCT